MLSALQREVARLKEKLEVLLGERGTQGQEAVRRADLEKPDYQRVIPAYRWNRLPPHNGKVVLIAINESNGAVTLAYSNGREWLRLALAP